MEAASQRRCSQPAHSSVKPKFRSSEQRKAMRCVCIVLKGIQLEAMGRWGGRTHTHLLTHLLQRRWLNLAATSRTQLSAIKKSKHVCHFSLNQISPAVYIGSSKRAHTLIWITFLTIKHTNIAGFYTSPSNIQLSGTRNKYT